MYNTLTANVHIVVALGVPSTTAAVLLGAYVRFSKGDKKAVEMIKEMAYPQVSGTLPLAY
jgi:hypothetical protein